MTEVLKTDYTRKNNVDMTIHVCRTGAKEQFYTLYQEGVAWGPFGATYWCNFIQNLSHKKVEAEAKARAYIERMGYHDSCHHLNLEIHDTPRPIYLRHEAFGVEMKMSKKRTMWWGHITDSAFWDEWKTNKDGIKKAGYWVKKDGYTWVLFKRVERFEEEYDMDGEEE